MRCEEIMKKTVACVTQQDSVQSAALRMREQNIGFLPVCEDGMRVVGAITDRDIALRACADDRSASSTKVADIMTKQVISCRPGDDVKQAEKLMSEHHKSRMICVDNNGKLVGIISLSDLAQHQVDDAAQTLKNVTTREARS